MDGHDKENQEEARRAVFETSLKAREVCVSYVKVERRSLGRALSNSSQNIV